MEIQCNRLDRSFRAHQREYEEKALQVLRSGRYVLGGELEAFEREFAAFLGGGESVGLGCGLDALRGAFFLLGVGAGDEVIVQGNTYIATVMGITLNGATPVFCEPDRGFSMSVEGVRPLLTPRTRAVLVTHLYGMTTPMEALAAFCREHGLFLVEDCAQAHGCRDGARFAGTFGDVGCFSFYPTKNLGCFGDGGAVWVRDPALARRFRIYRNYGSEEKYRNCMVGTNSRLDELQAGLLRVRLKYLEEFNAEKARIAARYLQGIANPAFALPQPFSGTVNVWHQFVIRAERRDELAAYLAARGIATQIHYPIPPHLAQAYRYLGMKKGDLPVTERLADTVLSLPGYYGMTEEEQDRVIEALNTFQ